MYALTQEATNLTHLHKNVQYTVNNPMKRYHHMEAIVAKVCILGNDILTS